jgi:hypothetical protein
MAVSASTLISVRSHQLFFVPTGFASSDTGYVNLTINTTLAIQVDSTNATINFGACTPQAGTSYWCASNDSAACSGTPANGNCSGDTTTPQFIRIDNVGNIDANITVLSECNAAQFIGGTSPAFDYIITQCNGTGVPSWTALSSGGATSACTNLSYLGGRMRLYTNVTIPNNAVGGNGGCSGQSTLTFTATQSG